MDDQAVMWPYHPQLLERPVPRYTSYPTAAEFTDMVGSARQDMELTAISDDQDISLYLHIPYCREICWYCGCNTGAANREKRLTAYIEALEQEIALIGAKLNGRGSIRRIAFGGGSPNAIAPVDFIRLLQQITLCLPVDRPEISVELDPRILSQAWIDALGAAGVSRASLGVQTFSPHVQQAIGRVQPAEAIERAVRGLRVAGVGSVNFDLMYGLPDQSLADLDDTLLRTAALRPERIAFFGYAHVPHLLPRQRQIKGRLPGVEERFAMAARGFERLSVEGYDAIGFDHFALLHDSLAIAVREGQVRRNFQGFTDDRAEVLIGLGASAISIFPGSIVQNEKNAGRYRMRLLAQQLPGARGVVKSRADRSRGRIIADILCKGEADLQPILRGYDGAAAVWPFMEQGLVRFEGSRLILKDEARPYARAIAACFDQYRQPALERFSHAV